MEQEIPAVCSKHGLMRISPGPLDEDGVFHLSASCGCTKSYTVGDAEHAVCPEHGRQQIIVQWECSCGNHFKAVLACGCQGGVTFFEGMSFFIRLDSSSEED